MGGRAVERLRRVAAGVVLPGVFYLGFFALFTWPWSEHFGSQFFTDTGDGYQNVWNMWWVNHSVTVLHQLPWHTNLLHWPYGTTLLGQTMNPFNGFVGIVLLRFLPLVEAFNTMVVFSFVATGVTAFWLCWYFCRRYLPALIGGFMVTFSAYHLSKTLGLMQLVSLEWVPLFILLWWRLLCAPRVRRAVGTAMVLLLVVLCDYYYFLFCVLGAVAIAGHLRRKSQLVVDRRASAVFLAIGAVVVAPLPVALVLSNVGNAMQGGHASQSVDLLSLVIDGIRWRFGSLTRWYYGSVTTNIADSTVCLGVTAAILVGAAVAVRKRLGPHVGFWLAFAAVAAVFSLGPRLVIGERNTGIPLPFAALRDALPLLEYNLEPDRIIVLTTIATAVLASMVLSRLDLTHLRGRVVIALVCVGLVFELWPASPPDAPVGRPAYVVALKGLPAGGVIDDAAVAGGSVDKSRQLYDQVLDGQPLAFGYISRTPATVAADDARLQVAIDAHQYRVLCHQYRFRYLTSPANRPLPGALKVLYDDGQAIIYDLC